MSQKRKRTLNDNFLTKKRLKKNTLSKVNSKALSIPHGAHCGSHQIAKIDMFKLTSQPLSSSSSDSSSSESSSERQFKDIEVKNEFSLTPGCGNCDLDCKLPNLLKDSDESNSGLTQILKEYPVAENEIDSIVNVVEFNKSLSPFFLKSNKYFKIDYPKDEHKIYLKEMIKKYKFLKQIKSNKKNVYKCNKIMYSNEDWKFRIIASKLTNQFLIDDTKFPDWNNWSNIITDVGNHFDRTETLQIKRNIKNDNKFLFTKSQFRKFVDFIPYMVFDNYFVCPCSIVTENAYCPPFKIARPISYFKCKSTIIFKDISELLSHLKPHVEFTGVSDNINRYSQILYYWLIIYRQITFQGYRSISLSKNNKQILNENIHHSISNKNTK